MLHVFSPSRISQSASEHTARFDLGQFVSRQFNFFYVLCSIVFLIVWPWVAYPLELWERVVWVVVALLGQVALVQGMKHVCYVPRPNTNRKLSWGRQPHSGLPSGHTVPAFLLATCVAVVHPLFGAIWYSGAAFIAWARWRTQAHYAYQVVFSALLGIMLAHLMIWCA